MRRCGITAHRRPLTAAGAHGVRMAMTHELDGERGRRIPEPAWCIAKETEHPRLRRRTRVKDPVEQLKLYTCTIAALAGNDHFQVFCAITSRSLEEVRQRLISRFGPWLASSATIKLGFDASEPLACALVSDAMAELLTLASEAPSSPLGAGLDFHVEQRFSG
jgi:hypothetical protein